MYANTTQTVQYNVAVGGSALEVNQGSGNTAVGESSLVLNTTGTYNTAVGRIALQANTTASNNTAVGYSALSGATSGGSNTAVGYLAGNSGNGAAFAGNTLIGLEAGKNITGADSNVCIGILAGAYSTSINTGNGNICIGGYTGVSATSDNYSIVMGYGINGKGTSTGFISPNGGGVYQGNNSTTWSTTSDQRLKKNIVDNNTGLEKLNAIQVRNFEYRLPEEVDAELKPTDAIKKTGTQLGVIAQELQAVLPECVKTESTGVMSVDTDNLIWYAINSIKELKSQLDSVKAELATLKGA
jgi:hypothetical protein